MKILDKYTILNQQNGKTLYSGDSIIGHNDENHFNSDESLTQNEWMIKNIPFIHTPEKKMDEVYYFRWRNLLNSICKRRSDGKYEICESGISTPWYHKYIDCADGAHIREARWIRDRKYLNDNIDLIPEKPLYREYIIDSVWQKYLIDGEVECIEKNYLKLQKRFSGTEKWFDKQHGLYYCNSNSEGQEGGINGFSLLQSMFEISSSFDKDSISYLADNETRNKDRIYYSVGNKFDYIEYTVPIEGYWSTGFRVWFVTNIKKGFSKPLSIKIFYKEKDNEYRQIENKNIEYPEYPRGVTEITYPPKKCDEIRIEFENDCINRKFTAISEIIPLFKVEPSFSENWFALIDGNQTFRVGFNCYQCAAAFALAKMATLLGKENDSAEYLRKASELKKQINEKLWCRDEHFFMEHYTKSLKKGFGKESCAYAPWMFGIAPDKQEFASAFSYATDKEVFLVKYGITSLEKNNPHYMQSYNHSCLWNGPVWPYTFSMFLTSVANLLHFYNEKSLKKEDFYDLLMRYTLCHHESNTEDILALREDHHPELNKWLAQAPDYNHSTYVDNILNGLFGICPMENGSLAVRPIVPDEWDFFCVQDVWFYSNALTILYDKTGNVYNLGSGYRIFINDKCVFESDVICDTLIHKKEKTYNE